MSNNSTTKRSWIYDLNKTELQEKLKDLNITFTTEDTVKDLRKLLSTYCKQIQNKKSIKMNYSLQPFDGEGWEVFEQQLECIITLNEVSDDKKVPLLLTKITPKVLEVLNCLCTPTNPVNLTYTELCKKLRNKYIPTQSTALDRAAFRSRNQMPTENIEDYVLQLRKLGGKCNFKDLDDQIKEKLIDGVSSKLIKFELLKNCTEMDLEKTILLARTVEIALIQTTTKSDNVPEMFFYQRGKINKKSNQTKTSMNKANRDSTNQTNKCFCCGGLNHVKDECRLLKKFCSECGKQGHIFKMCRNKTPRTYVLEKEGETELPDDEEEDVETSVAQLFNEYQMYSVNKQNNM
ncbi:uncharacterized protein LOC126367775 isoform X2 [Pectinophora gossypiella]|uniref:uncharacterized protein LOC126367775 isoform X2 n=1 Tax=Pectinophora gossypiella TaxID=13191 RepID=UPI00214E2DD4|nr:uncharacterized protein LOC126367775 isoform X2 [Pectinophora gossypiella]